MATTPTWDLPLPEDGQTPWGDDYRAAMLTIDDELSVWVANLTDSTDLTVSDLTLAARG